MKISAFEKKSGLTRDTIRFYEKRGMLPAPKRSENGYKIYTESHLAAVRFIEKGKAIGFTLNAIKQGYARYLALGHMCPEFKSQLMEKKRFFEARIKEDQSVVSQIEHMLEN